MKCYNCQRCYTICKDKKYKYCSLCGYIIFKNNLVLLIGLDIPKKKIIKIFVPFKECEACHKYFSVTFFRRHARFCSNSCKFEVILRKNHRNLKFKGQYYDSMRELEISICLHEQFKYNPSNRQTLHIFISRCEYDYLLESFKLFIEFHPWDLKYTKQEYYKKRRKNLDDNGYEDYKLIVI